jgi:outer membrane protein assembly factor BamE (lipoprotein component of BamABCDE complex)
MPRVAQEESLMVRTPPLAATALALGLIASLAGCARIRDHKGYVVDSGLISSIQPGIDNRDSVAKTLGRPTFAGQFNDRDWYYVSRDTRALAFSNPRAEKQLVLAVHFDQAGNVASVERTGLEKVASISPNGDKTPTLGRKRGFFRDLFGNIGRVGGTTTGSTADNPNGP